LAACCPSDRSSVDLPNVRHARPSGGGSDPVLRCWLRGSSLAHSCSWQELCRRRQTACCMQSRPVHSMQSTAARPHGRRTAPGWDGREQGTKTSRILNSLLLFYFISDRPRRSSLFSYFSVFSSFFVWARPQPVVRPRPVLRPRPVVQPRPIVRPRPPHAHAARVVAVAPS
jgi:hypothetical protein